MRHHSAGVSSNLIQKALQGRRGVAGGLEENWGAEVGVGEWGDYPQVFGLGISRVRAARISRRGTDHNPLLAAASNIKLMLGHSNWMTNTL